MANIKLSYLYRDEDNNKTFYTVVFTNRQKLAAAAVIQALRPQLIDSEYFYPQRWHLPFHTDADPTDAYTDWAEWEGVQETDQAPTQVLDIADFMAMAIAQARPLP